MLVLVHGLQDGVAEHRHSEHHRDDAPPVGIGCAEGTGVERNVRTLSDRGIRASSAACALRTDGMRRTVRGGGIVSGG